MKAKESINKVVISALALALWAVLAVQVSAQTAPDATDRGPFETTNAEYKFDAVNDPEITVLATQIWARMYRPVDLSQGPFPLVIFLHGNHNTCGRIDSTPPFPPGLRIDDNNQYTFTGTCPPTSPIVTPNHDGYTYLADQLASHGYIIVSINANRGINAAPGVVGDAGLNLARGRLILRHLQRLSEWNTIGGAPDSLGVGPDGLKGRLDFSQLGMMGHSRGGEGVRAAYNQFRDAGSPWPARIGPTTFRGIFEIGPVDGQTSRVLNADGTAWNVLLPMCDGDVFNLQGVKPFDRMLRIFTDNPATQKSTYAVWGANHNFYNTEWQVTDSDGCVGNGNPPLFDFFVGSPEQRQTSLASLMAFFRGNVGGGADPTFNDNFNPLSGLPDVVTEVTRVDRGFIPSPNSNFTAVFEDFDRPTGTNSSGVPNNANGISIEHAAGIPQHDPSQRTAFISWVAPGGFFQANWAAVGTGRDASGFDTLDFRVSRQCGMPDDANCRRTSLLNDPGATTNFSIRLVLADETLSDPVQLNDALAPSMDLTGPIGVFIAGFGSVLHPILQTARIPLGNFSVDLSRVRGVRFTFDDTPAGAIYLGNIRLTKGGLPSNQPASGRAVASFLGAQRSAGVGGILARGNITEGNTMSIRTVVASVALGNEPGVEVVVNSAVPFPVRDELAVLKIGNQEFSISRYPDTGENNTLIFTLTVQQFASTNEGDPISVQYGSGEAVGVQWSFGPLSKAAINQ